MLRWLAENVTTLILAFVLALFVWFVAIQETNPVVEQAFRESIPIAMLNQPPGSLLTNTPDTTVDVVIKGPQQEVDALVVDDFHAAVDLADILYGGVEVPVVVTVNNSLVSIVEQDTKSIYVNLDEYRRVSLPIEPLLTGAAALGYIVGEPELEPSEVILEGAAIRVDQVVRAEVRLSIDGSQETVQETVAVRLRDANGRLLTGLDPQPSDISVTVPITKSDEYAELFVTVDLTGTIAAGYRLADFSVEPQRVVIYGRPEVVAELPGFVSTVPVELTGADADFLQRVGLVVPEGVTLIGNQSVVVEINIEPVVTTLTVPWRPQILGPDEGLTATISPDTVNVGLVGPLELINSFDPQTDLDLTVNLYSLRPGSYQVSLTALSNLTGVEVDQVLPDTVQVEISLLPTPTPTSTLEITTTVVPTSAIVSPLATPTRTVTPTGTPTRASPTVTPGS